VEADFESRSRYSRSINDSIRFFKSAGLRGNLSCERNRHGGAVSGGAQREKLS